MVRLQWRPSRALSIALVVLGFLGAFAVALCEMPRWCAVPLAVASMAEGARLARSQARRDPRALAWSMGGALTVDGVHAQSASLHWRGPLAFLRWVDDKGHCHRLAWWPDTLSRAQRRELRLAATGAPRAATLASMAP